MTISHRASTGITARTTQATHAFTLPTGHTTNDLLIAWLGGKPYTVTDTLNDSTYSATATGANGTNATTANGAGSVQAAGWYKRHSGTESAPSVTMATATPNPMIQAMSAYQCASGKVWVVQTAAGSDSASTGTTFSAASDTTLTLAVGDVLSVMMVHNDDSSSSSAWALSAPGITFSTVTQRLTGTLTTASGGDGRMYVVDAEVTSGSGTVTVTATATTGTNDSDGEALFVVMREVSGVLLGQAGPVGVDDLVHSVSVQPDGKVVVGGAFEYARGVLQEGIARLNVDGSLDTGFNTGTNPGAAGSPTIDVLATVTDPDGKIIVSGDFQYMRGVEQFNIARLGTDGSLDTGFNTGLYPGTSASAFLPALALQSDGKIVVGGAYSKIRNVTKNFIARLNADATVDSTFNIGANLGTNATVYQAVLQSDGKVVIGGTFTTARGVTVERIARLNTDGTLDTSFNTGGTVGVNLGVYAMAIDGDGKILIGGAFTTVRGSTWAYLARLNTDGTLDTSFATSNILNGQVNSIVVQPSDGKIVIAGEFTTCRATTVNRVYRLNTDGTNDTTFTIDGTAGVNDIAHTLSLYGEKIVVGGSFTTARGILRNRVARLNADGSLDVTFNTDVLTEADTAFPVTVVQGNNGTTVTCTYPTETDTAQATTKSKAKTLGFATEVSSWTPVTNDFETDDGYWITAGRSTDVAHGGSWSFKSEQADGTGYCTMDGWAVAPPYPEYLRVRLWIRASAGTGFVNGFSVSTTWTQIDLVLTVGLFMEGYGFTPGAYFYIDDVDFYSARYVSPKRTKVLGYASETDVAFPLVADTGQTVVCTFPTESNTSQPVTQLKTFTVAYASETDAAQAVTRSRVRTVAEASESDEGTALALRSKSLAVGFASEGDDVLSLTRAKVLLLAVSYESDTAQPVTAVSWTVDWYPPDAILSMTGLTGVVAYIRDSPTSPDTDELTPTGGPIDVRFSFEGHGQQLRLGEGDQVIRVLVTAVTP